MHPDDIEKRPLLLADLPEAAAVNLIIYDCSGRLVCELAKSEHLQAGRHRRAWDGRDRSGLPVVSGVYFLCMEAGDFMATEKLTLLK